MSRLVHQRCFNHAAREAVARCPSCGRFFCRECITEHDQRVICASCLGKLLAAAPRRRSVFGWVLPGVQGVFGLVAAWFFFHLIGEMLSSLPAAFHERTIWKTHWLDSE